MDTLMKKLESLRESIVYEQTYYLIDAHKLDGVGPVDNRPSTD